MISIIIRLLINIMSIKEKNNENENFEIYIYVT
jgi:hypothetical protein